MPNARPAPSPFHTLLPSSSHTLLPSSSHVMPLPAPAHLGCSLADVDTPALGEKIPLVPGHCDPTVNLHDWFVCVRHGVVEALWPVTARGMIW